MHYLKQSTAVTVVAGPFVDDTDGKTAETGLTISQGDCLLWKEGGTTLAAKNESTSATHRSNGLYTVPLDATDTNTLGVLHLSINESGALPVRHDFTVLAAQQYNSLIAASDKLQVDAVEINSSTTAAAQQAILATVCPSGTAKTAGGSFTNSGALVFYAQGITEATADHFNGGSIIFTSGALLYQRLSVTDYEWSGGAYLKFTCSQATEVPANDDTFIFV
jgi:hypothetical protein